MMLAVAITAGVLGTAVGYAVRGLVDEDRYSASDVSRNIDALELVMLRQRNQQWEALCIRQQDRIAELERHAHPSVKYPVDLRLRAHQDN